MNTTQSVPQLGKLRDLIAKKLDGNGAFSVGEVSTAKNFRTKTYHFIIYINEINDNINYEVHYEIHQEDSGNKKMYLRLDVHIREYEDAKNLTEDELIAKFGEGVCSGKLDLIDELGYYLETSYPDFKKHASRKIGTALYAAKMSLPSTDDAVDKITGIICDSKDIIVQALKAKTAELQQHE